MIRQMTSAALADRRPRGICLPEQTRHGRPVFFPTMSHAGRQKSRGFGPMHPGCHKKADRLTLQRLLRAGRPVTAPHRCSGSRQGCMDNHTRDFARHSVARYARARVHRKGIETFEVPVKRGQRTTPD